MRRLRRAIALAAVGAAVAAIAAPATTTAEDPGTTPVVVQAPPALAFISVRAIKRSVKLRRRAILVDWGVRNPTPDLAAENVVTCVQFPKGFRISYNPANRPPAVQIHNSRHACVPLGTIHPVSYTETLVEGYAPRKPGNYRIRFTATADNAPAISKTVTLRVLRRCSARQCPGFSS